MMWEILTLRPQSSTGTEAAWRIKHSLKVLVNCYLDSFIFMAVLPYSRKILLWYGTGFIKALELYGKHTCSIYLTCPTVFHKYRLIKFALLWKDSNLSPNIKKWKKTTMHGLQFSYIFTSTVFTWSLFIHLRVGSSVYKQTLIFGSCFADPCWSIAQ